MAPQGAGIDTSAIRQYGVLIEQGLNPASNPGGTGNRMWIKTTALRQPYGGDNDILGNQQEPNVMHYKRKLPRCRSRSRARQDRERQVDLERRLGDYSKWLWLGNWPQWWDLMFHRRPHRTATKQALRKVKTGYSDPDEIAWPLAKKPHRYYW